MEDETKKGKELHVLADTEDKNKHGKRNLTTNELATFDFTKKSWSSDLVLIVEGTKLYVAKNILSLASPVFFAMFQSEFKEGSLNEMELPGKRKDDVVEFLGCLYPNLMSEVSSETATRILPLAEEYQVLQLKTKCENVLLENVKSDMSTQNLCQVLSQACLYNLKRLRERCIQVVSSKPLEQLQEASKKLQLPPKTSNEIVVNILNECIEEHTRKLQALCSEMSEANEALKNFISTELEKKNDFQKLKRQNRKEKLVVLTVSVDKVTKVTEVNKTIELWGKSLSVCVEIKKNTESGRFVHIQQPCLFVKIIFNEEKSLICDVGIRCFLVSSRHLHIDNKSFVWEEEIKEKKQKVECALVSIRDVMSEDRGFIRDGKLSLIVQLVMSEPLQQ